MIIVGTTFGTSVTRNTQRIHRPLPALKKKKKKTGLKSVNTAGDNKKSFPVICFDQLSVRNKHFLFIFFFAFIQHPPKVFLYFCYPIHRSRLSRWGTVQKGKEKRPKEKYSKSIR